MKNLFSNWLSSKRELNCTPDSLTPSSTVKFTVETKGYTRLSVFDLNGREMVTLFSGDAEPGKEYTTGIDAENLASGAYFYKLVNNEHSFVKKVMLVK